MDYYSRFYRQVSKGEKRIVKGKFSTMQNNVVFIAPYSVFWQPTDEFRMYGFIHALEVIAGKIKPDIDYDFNFKIMDDITNVHIPLNHINIVGQFLDTIIEVNLYLQVMQQFFSPFKEIKFTLDTAYIPEDSAPFQCTKKIMTPLIYSYGIIKAGGAALLENISENNIIELFQIKDA